MNADKLKRVKKRYKQSGHHKLQTRIFKTNDPRLRLFDFDYGVVMGLTSNTEGMSDVEMSDAIGYNSSQLGYDVYRMPDGQFLIDGVEKDQVFSQHDGCPVLLLVPPTLPEKSRIALANKIFEHRNEGPHPFY